MSEGLRHLGAAPLDPEAAAHLAKRFEEGELKGDINKLTNLLRRAFARDAAGQVAWFEDPADPDGVELMGEALDQALSARSALPALEVAAPAQANKKRGDVPDWVEGELLDDRFRTDKVWARELRVAANVAWKPILDARSGGDRRARFDRWASPLRLENALKHHSREERAPAPPLLRAAWAIHRLGDTFPGRLRRSAPDDGMPWAEVEEVALEVATEEDGTRRLVLYPDVDTSDAPGWVGALKPSNRLSDDYQILIALRVRRASGTGQHDDVRTTLRIPGPWRAGHVPTAGGWGARSQPGELAGRDLPRLGAFDRRHPIDDSRFARLPDELRDAAARLLEEVGGDALTPLVAHLSAFAVSAAAYEALDWTRLAIPVEADGTALGSVLAIERSYVDCLEQLALVFEQPESWLPRLAVQVAEPLLRMGTVVEADGSRVRVLTEHPLRIGRLARACAEAVDWIRSRLTPPPDGSEGEPDRPFPARWLARELDRNVPSVVVLATGGESGERFGSGVVFENHDDREADGWLDEVYRPVETASDRTLPRAEQLERSALSKLVPRIEEAGRVQAYGRGSVLPVLRLANALRRGAGRIEVLLRKTEADPPWLDLDDIRAERLTDADVRDLHLAIHHVEDREPAPKLSVHEAARGAPAHLSLLADPFSPKVEWALEHRERVEGPVSLPPTHRDPGASLDQPAWDIAERAWRAPAVDIDDPVESLVQHLQSRVLFSTPARTRAHLCRRLGADPDLGLIGGSGRFISERLREALEHAPFALVSDRLFGPAYADTAPGGALLVSARRVQLEASSRAW